VATQQKVKFASPGAVFPQVKKWPKKFQTTFFIQKKFGKFFEKEKKIKRKKVTEYSCFFFFKFTQQNG